MLTGRKKITGNKRKKTYAEGKLSPNDEFVSSDPIRFKSLDDLLLKKNEIRKFKKTKLIFDGI